MKKLFIIIVSLFIAFCPCMTLCDFSYADEPADEQADWTRVDPDDNDTFMKCVLLFLRANRFVYKQTPAGIATKWTYEEFKRMCYDSGISMTELSQQMKYKIDQTGKYTFYIVPGLAHSLNYIYEHMLTAYGLQANEYKVIYSGKYYTDADNNPTMCFIIPSTNVHATFLRTDSNNYFSAYGEQWKHDGEWYAEHYTSFFNVPSSTPGVATTINCSVVHDIHKSQLSTEGYFTAIKLSTDTTSSPASVVYIDSDRYIQGFDTIGYYPKGDSYHLMSYLLFNRRVQQVGSNPAHDAISIRMDTIKSLSKDNNFGDASVEADQGDRTNYPEDKDTILTEPDDENDIPEPQEPEKKPDQKPVPPDSTTPNPDNPNIDTGNPDYSFQMPNINIDWNLDLDPDNLPFPFSIPNDIYHAFDSLNVEAEAPHFEGTVDLYICEWDIDIDFEQFASLANIFNKWFLFVYVVGLIIATRSLMHIY